MPGVKLSKVEKSFGPAKVIHGVSMEIDRGEFAVFVGPSGCGKSTLLRMIAGPRGDHRRQGRDRRARRHPGGAGASAASRWCSNPTRSTRTSPSTRTWPSACGLRTRPKAELEPRSARPRGFCSSRSICEKKPSQLSGGQRQRVAIGRAIVREPKVFLFDEPLSNLDAELRVQMRLELARLHRQIGATMIYVTHDQVEAMTLADKIFVLQSGVVRQSGRPLDLYDDPNNRFVAGFIGSPSMNFVAGKVVERTGEGVAVALDGSDGAPITARIGSPLDPGARVTLGMRPEHIEIAGDGAGFSVAVEMEEDLGGVSYLHGRLASGQPIVLERRGGRENFEGRKIVVTVPPDRALVFDEAGERVR